MKYLVRTIALGVALCACRADAQTFKTLLSFTGSGGTASGVSPYGSLAISGSTLYGMTQAGGAGLLGNVFSVAVNGTNYKNLLSFTGNGGTANGSSPHGSLTLGGTTLYGMTEVGGAAHLGNVFSVAVNGTNFQNLLSFTGTGGAASGWDPIGSNPDGGLTLSGTTLYGMTEASGGLGNIFSVG